MRELFFNGLLFLLSMTFSQRNGYKRIKDIQTESIDNELKNRLWNLIWKIYFKNVGGDILYEEAVKDFFEPLWEKHYKLTIDRKCIHDFRMSFKSYLEEFKERYFENKNEWYDYYDLIEFIVNETYNHELNTQFKLESNELLKSEISGYRFVDGKICSIISDKEIKEVEKALESPLEGVNKHFQNALDLFSDKQNPSYSNSIKESISAVEAVCRLIIKDGPTLGKALEQIEKEGSITIPTPLKQALDKLYGYSSSTQGIRHSYGITEKPDLKEDDARFFLITCSAFVNYLTSKCIEVGIKLS